MKHTIFFSFFKKAIVGIFAGGAFIFTLASCNPSIAEVEHASLHLQKDAGLEMHYDVPLSSENELMSLTKNGDDTLDYRIARKTAIIEFETGYRTSLEWPQGLRLSKRPVVIYNADSKPEIYEFFVLEEGSPIGTVSTYAHTKYPEIIRNVLPFVRDYKPYITKYNGYKQINDYYPLSVYVGVVSKSGGEVSNVIDPATGEAQDPPRIEQPATEPEEIQNAKAVAKIYWEIVLEHADEILQMTDEELYAKLETKGYEYKYKNDTYMAKKFEQFGNPNEEPLARTYWNGWCVPSAIAQFLWVYKNQQYNGVHLPHIDGSSFELTDTYIENKKKITRILRVNKNNTGSYEFLYDIEDKGRENPTSNGRYKPLVNKDAIKVLSEKIDNGLYYDVVNALDVGSNWNGGSTTTKGVQVIKELTNNSVGHIWLGGDGLNMHNHIKNRKGPILDGIRSSKTEGHTRLLVGTKYYWYEHYNWWHTYYWYIKRWYKKWGWLWTAEWAQGSHRWETSVLSGEWGTKFLVWDNGYKTESHGYVPYWENNTTTANSRYWSSIWGLTY